MKVPLSKTGYHTAASQVINANQVDWFLQDSNSHREEFWTYYR